MFESNNSYSRWPAQVADCAIAVAAVCGVILHAASGSELSLQQFMSLRITVKNLFLISLFALVWNLAFRAVGAYGKDAFLEPFRRAALRVTIACTAGALFALLVHGVGLTSGFDLLAIVQFWSIATVS